MKPVALKPRLSEKTYAASEQLNTYVFDVPKGANKHMVAQAVQAQYKVTVTNVRTAAVAGKVKRTYRKGGRSVQRGQRPQIRKAYVTLKDGDILPVFAAVEDSSKENK